MTLNGLIRVLTCNHRAVHQCRLVELHRPPVAELLLIAWCTVQAVDRALVVDILPPSQQEKGNAWAGRMFGTGSLAGFWV
jgi:hypothetical protein